MKKLILQLVLLSTPLMAQVVNPPSGGGGGSAAGPLGAVQVAGASGAFAQGTGDANYQSVVSTPLSGSQGSLQIIANSVVDQMAQTFTDGTPYWCAGLGYCSLGIFAEDYTYSLIQNPSKFPTEINGVAGTSTIRNIVGKFIAQVDGHGQIPAAINAAGTAASVTYSGWDNNHAFYSGVAMYMLPLDCFADYQKTGSTLCYTTYVNAFKTAQAYSPINGTSHLPTNVVGASEWIAQSLFLEQERPSGDVANASVLRAASDAVLAQMATAADDSANATFFNIDFTNVTASIQSEFIDPTSHMLWSATGQNKQIDVLTSGMAVWLSRFTGQNILTLAQQKAIGTFLHTNLATMTYNGYFANTVTTGGAVTSWVTTGIIPVGGGGGGYTSDGCSAGVYQQGYWSLVTGMNGYALSLTNASDVSVLLASFRDALSGSSNDPAWEYYDQAHGHSAAGCTPAFSATATTPNLESPQGAAWVAANIVGPTAVAAGLGTTDKYGATVTGTGGSGLTNPFTVATLPQVIEGTGSGVNVLTVKNNSTSGYSSYNANNPAGAAELSFGYGNTGTGDMFAGIDYVYGVGNPICFRSTIAGCGIYIDTSHNLLLGTTTTAAGNPTATFTASTGAWNAGSYLARGTGTPWASTAFAGAMDTNNGSADGGPWRGYYAANKNIAFNVSNSGVPTSCTTAEILRYVIDDGESGGAVIGGIDRAGYICGWLGLRMPSAGLIAWNGDTGLSRDAAGIVDCGNGTAGSKSCTFNATAINLGGVPVIAPISGAVTSATGGSGTGTITCVTAACTNLRGSYTVAGGTFATGTLLTLVWPTTTTAYVCSGSVLNNATGASIGYHSVATATGMTFSSLTAATGLSIDIDYSCQP